MSNGAQVTPAATATSIATAQSHTDIFWDLLDEVRWHWRSWSDIKSMSWFTMTSYTNFYMFIFFVAFAVYQARNNAKKAKTQGPNKQWLPAPEFPGIIELPDFSWKDETPLKIRPFKPKYHLTMALQKLDPSELIAMDKTYADRMEFRKKTMKELHDVVVNVNNDGRVRGAVQELYNWLMGTYLPGRYPKMFKLHFASFETGDTYMLENLVTKAILPAKADKSASTATLLENLGKTVDDDLLFLIPEEAEKGKEADSKYILEACICCCPSGFDPRQKTGRRLAEIHTPVPGYNKILEGSMDRYFNKIAVGEYMQRANWNVTTHGELCSYQAGSNHVHDGDEIEEMKEIDVNNTFVRVERQTLHRLPKSKALVFAFKTYLYPIKDIKEEGLGEELSQAIDGMMQGNVPDMHTYKRGVVWGEAVKRYLRS